MRYVTLISEAYLRSKDEKINEFLGIDWLKVRLPRTVQAALLDSKLIDDPYFADNFRKIQWIPENTWLYRIKVKKQEGKKAKLVFHGIDYRSIFYHGDVKLTEHEGMFSPIKIDVSHLPEEFDLMVEVLPNKLDERPYIIYPFWGLKKNMRFSMSYGWDFAPRIITIGIWDSVELIETDEVFIDDPYVWGDIEGNVYVSFKLEGEKEKYDIVVEILDDNGNKVAELKETSDVKNKEIAFKMKVNNVEFWWPWNFGDPTLYTAVIRVEDRGEVLDEVAVPFGFKKVIKKGTKFYINGQRTFIRGVNWVPADSMLRLDDARYERLLRYVRELNANIIRVWGGGLRERRKFYDLADKLGIMIWQEFPFACEDIEISERMKNLVRRESAEIIKYLRNYPSITLWSGGNELNYRKSKPILDILGENVRILDPKTPYQPVSPYGGDAHGWYVWHGFTSIYAYRMDKSTLMSEFGMQAVPKSESLIEFLPKDKLWPPNELWAIHHAQLEKHVYYTVLNDLQKVIYLVMLQLIQFAIPFLGTVFGINPGAVVIKEIVNKAKRMKFKEFIRKNQFIQALALKIGVEHFRLNRERYDGSIIWQFNDPWPNMSWSIVDYFGRKKMSYHFIRQSYEPVQTFLVKEGRKLSVYLLNDTLKDVNVKIIVNALRKGKKVPIAKFNTSVKANSKIKVSSLKYRTADYLVETIINGKRVINIYPAQFFVRGFGIIDKIIVDLAYMGSRAQYGT